LRSGQSLSIFLPLILSLSLYAFLSFSKRSDTTRLSKYAQLASKKTTRYEERFEGEELDLLKL